MLNSRNTKVFGNMLSILNMLELAKCIVLLSSFMENGSKERDGCCCCSLVFINSECLKSTFLSLNIKLLAFSFFNDSRLARVFPRSNDSIRLISSFLNMAQHSSNILTLTNFFKISCTNPNKCKMPINLE
eukprot:NODE_4_length_55019_cov_0.425091.p37 type:complete len:130 gc:universal NODE_4_length_55019_cov_0.425091:36124-35735(-)